MADDKVSRSAVEDGDLVLAGDDRLSSFVIKDNDVIGYFFPVVDHDLVATLGEGLDDLRGLWTRATAPGGTKAIHRTSATGIDFPRLAVGNENAGRPQWRRVLFSSRFGE